MNNEYRRGTVLGLTIAEIFILLIFLILLALLGLASNWEEKEKEYRADRQVLSVWRDIIEEFQAPEKIRTLHRKATRLEQQLKNNEVGAEKTLTTLSAENAELREMIEEIHEERERLHNENTKLSNENFALHEDRKTLREQVATARQDKDEEGAALQEEIETIREEHEELHKENTRLSNRNAVLRQEAAAETQKAERIKADLDTLRRKGQNPPCWYETVFDGSETREKAHYIFNIGVYDDYMVVRRHPIPLGLADDDNGRPYAEEAVDPLRLEDIPYNTRLSYEDMTRNMKRIRDLGKMRKVRSYSCIFWVKVWDKTSPDAKARWKNAHDGVLEGLFGTYLVKDDPWPESP